ncbi:MAG TPA: PEP/pyruvate-binding domain-containing protein, partial [Phenylobacterium sp.]
MPATDYIRSFESLGVEDVALVGGKTASLGELRKLLAGGWIEVPEGFAITAEAYRDALTEAGVWERLRALFSALDLTDVTALARTAAEAREIVYQATGGAGLRDQILAAYRALRATCGPDLRVAVRSSATAEDLPTASFAGQHESFLHVRDEADLVEACRRCFASIFTDRAIVYRHDNGFDQLKVFLSVAVMRMIHSDEAASGVIFTLDTESGFRDVVFVTGVYGLGETIVQGRVEPDEFYVHKPTLRQGYRTVLSHRLGAKAERLTWRRARRGAALRTIKVPRSQRESYCVSDAEVLDLADVALKIEAHYSARAGRPTPMDIEWAKDAFDGRLYVVQARPETVASQRTAEIKTYRMLGEGVVLATG